MFDYHVQAEVDLDAIRHNIIEMKRHIRPDTKLLAVIKADAYGHGAVAVARALDDLADYFAVAQLAEAEELREYGVDKPILILGHCPPAEFADMIKHQVTINLFRLEDAEDLSQTAQAMRQTANVHLKIDTGMNRIGFPCNRQSVDDIKKIAGLPNLHLEGIFTHFAKADERNKDAFHLQLDRFRQMLETLEAEGITFPLRHASNSAAIMEAGDLDLDMVRSGIATYGLYPSDEVDMLHTRLRPAMSLRSKVSHVKTVPAGEGIGYGWSYITEKETKVATVPVGYADGYKRALSNQGRVLIHGVSAPIIGRICMDQFMIDVTQIEDVQVGDIVTLFGEDQTMRIPVEELADASASFQYEFICGITRRVPRIYTWEGQTVGVLNYLSKEPLQWWKDTGTAE